MLKIREKQGKQNRKKLSFKKIRKIKLLKKSKKLFLLKMRQNDINY